jgi:D-sedoheptulose 7-phosphate isomerase
MRSEINPKEAFESAISMHLEVVRELTRQLDVIEAVALAMTEALLGGGKVLWCGNGGSAADCQHLAAEIVGRFSRERRGMPSIALTTDSSILTAVANDYGFQCVFSRQVEALARPGDVLVGISTSGNSQNVIMALEQARSMGVTTIALTGAGGGKLSAIADHTLAVPSTDTARIQEAHILVGHMLCDRVEVRWMQTQQEEATRQQIEAR